VDRKRRSSALGCVQPSQYRPYRWNRFAPPAALASRSWTRRNRHASFVRFFPIGTSSPTSFNSASFTGVPCGALAAGAAAKDPAANTHPNKERHPALKYDRIPLPVLTERPQPKRQNARTLIRASFTGWDQCPILLACHR
jgi:hypothetical protein